MAVPKIVKYVLDKIAEHVVALVVGALIAWGAVVIAAALSLFQAVRQQRDIQIIVGVLGVSLLVLALVAVAVEKISFGHQRVQHPSTQLATAPVPMPPAVQLSIKAVDDLYKSFDAHVRDEIEKAIRDNVSQIPSANDKVEFLIRGIVTVLIAGDYDSIWYNIFGSQIEALGELNAQRMERHQLLSRYTAAAQSSPFLYMNYSFDQWVGWMRDKILIREDGPVVSITWKGRDFLRFLVAEGRSARDRAY